MTIVDVNQLHSGVSVDADLCVVGSGAAGITVACQFDGSPARRVCLVESGGFGPDEDTQALYDLDVTGHPVRHNFMSRARYFGGTCNLWAGRCMRLTTLDFEARPWVPSSGWPIAYDELARYYPQASSLLKLPEFDALQDTLTRRANSVERHLLHRSEFQPTICMWGKKPLRFGAAHRKQLRASNNIGVYVNANVTEILLNRAGNHVDSCTAWTLGGKRIELRAKRFVVAAGGLETARLLLASRSVQPAGVGNDFDSVGRYYMDHPRAVFGTIGLSKSQKLPLLLGIPLAGGMAQIGIQLSNETQRRERLLNNYVTLERHWSNEAAAAYQSFVHSMKILLRKGYAGKRFVRSGARLATVPELIYLLAPRELMPHFLYRAARRVREFANNPPRELIVVNYCEQAPNRESRVYLGSTRDRLDVPKLVLDWKIGRAETESLLRLHALLDQHFREEGLGAIDHRSREFDESLYTDASHHIGTARMSTNSREGVVDRDCKVHGVDNLFIAGSAVFPTSGHANPTLTIVALALRLAAHLAGMN